MNVLFRIKEQKFGRLNLGKIKQDQGNDGNDVECEIENFRKGIREKRHEENHQ